MKKKVSVGELKKYCEQHKPQRIQFMTENQDWYRTADPCKMEISFPIMLIYENPSLICLKDSRNTLSFDRIKSVEIDTDSSLLGVILTIFCGDFNSDGYDITYKLVVA